MNLEMDDSLDLIKKVLDEETQMVIYVLDEELAAEILF